jgi:hypothetical protein
VRGLKKAGGGLVAVGLIACSVAVATCTGVGAIGIATGVAKAIVNSASSRVGDAVVAAAAGAAGGVVAAELAGGASSEEVAELRRHVIELEELMYGAGNERRIKEAANKVAVAWKSVKQ